MIKSVRKFIFTCDKCGEELEIDTRAEDLFEAKRLAKTKDWVVDKIECSFEFWTPAKTYCPNCK